MAATASQKRTTLYMLDLRRTASLARVPGELRLRNQDQQVLPPELLSIGWNWLENKAYVEISDHHRTLNQDNLFIFNLRFVNDSDLDRSLAQVSCASTPTKKTDPPDEYWEEQAMLAHTQIRIIFSA
eukprot:11708038-Heterocapsa_arctica.AAC.1